MSDIILLLGGNLGDRYAYLQKATAAIQTRMGEVVEVSAIYETACWGGDQQPDYLNQALRIQTTLLPEQVLDAALGIEAELGRVRTRMWEPRVMDIDLIFYDRLVYHSERLILPHPRIAVRKFVLIPLAELIPGYIHPVYHKSIAELLSLCPDPSAVKYWKPHPQPTPSPNPSLVSAS
ncbi:MAG: 2-amino-4-hydroxy-6-hydroxymethyldihydropteridine diphosphokinase [Thermoflavifilum aggregans]|nr:2-amino-4-hydroxy-6-hydroxymethyldihydropteridine diphosphokinase [Thermoflavifilum aggregans]